MSNSSTWPIDKTPSGAITLGQSWSGSNCNEGVLGITQSSSITGVLPSDYLELYPGHSLGVGVSPLQRCIEYKSLLNRSPKLEPYHQIQFTVITHDTHFGWGLTLLMWECLLMVWETGVQSEVKLWQRLKRWYLIPPCLILSNIWYVSRVVEQSRERSSALPYTSV